MSNVTLSIHADGYIPTIKILSPDHAPFAVVVIADGADVFVANPAHLRILASVFDSAAEMLEQAQEMIS